MSATKKLHGQELEQFKAVMMTEPLKSLSSLFGIGESTAWRYRKNLSGYDSGITAIKESIKTAKKNGSIRYHGSLCSKCKTTEKYTANNTCVYCQCNPNDEVKAARRLRRPKTKKVISQQNIKEFKTKVAAKVEKKQELTIIEKEAKEAIEAQEEQNRILTERRRNAEMKRELKELDWLDDM
jgi:hypothetical protein